MVIELYVNELVNQMRAVSHKEVEGVADVEERYRIEAGSEKMDEIHRCLSDAFAKLSHRCSRFIKRSYTQEADNVHSIPQIYHLEFSFSERRALNKGAELVNAMHNFVLEYALSKFYLIVNQGDLSNKHSLLAIDEGNVIDQMLMTKMPPRV